MLRLVITNSAFNSYPNSDRYVEAQSYREILQGQNGDTTAYNTVVKVAGDTLLDLTRTLNNDAHAWSFTSGDPNVFDKNKDPTGGSAFFYSPDNAEAYGSTGYSPETPSANSIDGTLSSHSSLFPTAGSFQNTVCTAWRSLCNGNPPVNADYIQVVVVSGIPYNDCYGIQAGKRRKDQAPQFIFLRWRNNTDPAVVELVP